MRKWLLAILLLSVLIFPSIASAQGVTKLKSIHIQLWSEYDRPSMLVIHEFIVDQGTPLPAEVTLRFPKSSNLNAVAYLDANGKLIDADYTGPAAQGDWQTVNIKVTSYDPYRIEYYQSLTRNGNQRSFSFRWFGDYDVDQFTVTMQVPADSTNLVADPPFTSTSTSEDGIFIVGTIESNGLKMGQSNVFKLQYERQSEAVTKPSNSANIQPAKPIDSNTQGRVSIDSLPWIIGGFGLALIGMALYFYWRSTQQMTDQKSRRRRRSKQSEEESGDEQVYCHECGTRARPGDRFCRTCGSKLRAT
jgi:hypothetical protein